MPKREYSTVQKRLYPEEVRLIEYIRDYSELPEVKEAFINGFIKKLSEYEYILESEGDNLGFEKKEEYKAKTYFLEVGLMRIEAVFERTGK